MYMFCILTAVHVCVLYCDSGTCTWSVLWQRYMYVFCIVTAVRVHVLYCDSGTQENFEKHWSKKSRRVSCILQIYCDCNIQAGRSGLSITHCICLKLWFLFCSNLWKDTIINNYINFRWFEKKPVVYLGTVWGYDLQHTVYWSEMDNIYFNIALCLYCSWTLWLVTVRQTASLIIHSGVFVYNFML
jgi:hypothetical protein